MKTRKRSIAMFLAASLLVLPAYAVNDFKCKVKEVYDLKNSGFLEPGAGFVTPDVGSDFIVNRQSGQITAKKITNTMSGYMPVVYDVEPSENSYKAVTLYKPHYTIDLLEINTYVKVAEKPFIYKGAFGEVVTGTCVIQ